MCILCEVSNYYTPNTMLTTYQQLDNLDAELATGEIPAEQELWRGADVVIDRVEPPPMSGDSFYPEPRFVVTPHAGELSWIFAKLRDAFYAEERIDGCSKIEFFGRLANAAIRAIDRSEKPPTASILCAAVLHEGYAIYDEMEEGIFQFFSVAFGNEIADDYVDEALRSGFIGIEDTLSFFRERGVEVVDA